MSWLKVAVLAVSAIVAAGLLAAANRYTLQTIGSGSALRVDRWTGQVSPCDASGCTEPDPFSDLDRRPPQGR